MGGFAACGRCGSPVRVAALEPSRCRHCGGEAALAPSDRAALEQLRARIAASTAKAQQLEGDLAAFGRSFGGTELFMAAMLWGVVGGLFVAGAAGNLAPGDTLVGVLARPPAHGDVAFARAAFWLVFIVATGFGACVFFTALARFVARGQVRWVWAAPPAVAGEPPGCRVCGGALGPDGVVRRCRYCGADNVVDGVHFQRASSSLTGELRAREAALATGLAARHALVRRLDKLILGPPFALFAFVPVVFFLGAPRAELWAVPAGVFALAAVVFVASSLRPDPRR